MFKRPRLIKDKEKRKRVVHIVSAVTILIHAYENYETGHHSYILFGVAGLIVLALAIFHSAIEKKFPWVDGVFFVIEGILSLVVAIDMFNMGKKRLPITYLLLAAFQFFMAFRKGKKGMAAHKAKHDVKGIIVIKARLYLRTAAEGGRPTAIKTKYRPNHVLDGLANSNLYSSYIGEISFDDQEFIYPGETKLVTIIFLWFPGIEKYMQVGHKWFINEGARTIGEGEIVQIPEEPEN